MMHFAGDRTLDTAEAFGKIAQRLRIELPVREAEHAKAAWRSQNSREVGIGQRLRQIDTGDTGAEDSSCGLDLHPAPRIVASIRISALLPDTVAPASRAPSP